MAKKGLCIDVRVDVLMDERYDVIADVAGYNRHEALGRMFALWAWCLDKQQFVVHERVIKRFLGERGVDAILGDGVDDFALGERREDGIYVRGTEKLKWLGERRAAATKGGEERANAPRDDDGRFVMEPTPPPAKHHPDSSQATSQAPPNVQPLVLDLGLGSPSGKNASPRASPPRSPMAAVKACWAKRWRAAHGAHPHWTPNLEKHAANLGQAHGVDEVCKRIDLCFDSPPQWPPGPRDFKWFVDNFDKCIRAGPGAPGSDQPRAIPTRQQREQAQQRHPNEPP